MEIRIRGGKRGRGHRGRGEGAYRGSGDRAHGVFLWQGLVGGGELTPVRRVALGWGMGARRGVIGTKRKHYCCNPDRRLLGSRAWNGAQTHL